MPKVVLFAALYAIFTPVHEMCARGGIQCSPQIFLTGRFEAWYSIVLANVMFSLTHLHLSFVTALTVFPVGLLGLAFLPSAVVGRSLGVPCDRQRHRFVRNRARRRFQR